MLKDRYFKFRESYKHTAGVDP